MVNLILPHPVLELAKEKETSQMLKGENQISDTVKEHLRCATELFK